MNFLIFLLYLFCIHPNPIQDLHPRTYNSNVRGSDASREGTDYAAEHQADNIRAGLPECVQYNARATARANTKDTHPVPRKGLKTLTSPGIQRTIPVSKAGILPVTPQRWTFGISHVNEKDMNVVISSIRVFT